MHTIVDLWTHPVKSMQGASVSEVSLDERGVVGDRRWALRDTATGLVLTARRVPELLHAIGHDGAVELPDGTVTSDDCVLSAWLGRSVELIGVTDSVRSTYESPTDPLDGERDWIQWQGPAGGFVDSTRTAVSLISAASMREWDRRRFRMNVVLDNDGENDLVGRRVRIGDAILDVVKRVDRCVMVTRPQPGLDRDVDVLKTINNDHGGDFGIGALVASPGIIRVGDRLEPLD